MAEAIGKPLQMDPAMATLTASQVGSATASKAQFDMYWDTLVADDSSVLA
jgi:hypothetical protein